MELNFVWKENTLQYQTGKSLFLGRIKVAVYGWNSMRSKSELGHNNWVGKVLLPSLKEDTVHDDKTDCIESKLETIISNWFKEATKSLPRKEG